MHASEIPYVFDTVKAAYGEKLTQQDEAAARTTIAYWVSFARTGDPSPEGLPRWTPYDSKTDTIMDFTLTGPVVAPTPGRRALISSKRLQMQSRFRLKPRNRNKYKVVKLHSYDVPRAQLGWGTFMPSA